MKKYFYLLFFIGILFLSPSFVNGAYVCYPTCRAYTCVNDSCSSGFRNATAGDKISLVHEDLNLTKKVTIGDVQINNWVLKSDKIIEFVLSDNVTGMFVNVYDSEGGLIAVGSLIIYSKSDNNSTPPEPITPVQPSQPKQPSCTLDTWTCGAWGSCSPSGIRSRSCRKTFDCPSVETAVPETAQYCTPPNLDKYQVSPADQQVVNQDNIIKATVNLWCPLNKTWYSVGSGTIIDSKGTILTNKHVVSNTEGCLVGFVDSYKDEPYFGDRHIADISRISTDADIAILKLRNPYNKTLTYIDISSGNSDALRLGDKISTYGYPTKFGSKITSTRGEFSGVEEDFLKTTAIIDKGNSGGGAYLQDGSFIGIPTKVFVGSFNILGGILSVNKVKSWLSNTPITYNDELYNKYSRVSLILENVDLQKLDSFKLYLGGDIPEESNETEIEERESIVVESDVIESDNTNQEISPDQNLTPSEKDEKVKQKKSIIAVLINIFTAIKNFFINLFK